MNIFRHIVLTFFFIFVGSVVCVLLLPILFRDGIKAYWETIVWAYWLGYTDDARN